MIDPGHGGENNGTTSCGFLEKEMNLTTAFAMRDELSKFDGIKIYLTRDSDEELSLKDRAKAAENVHADFLISLHYNASESQELYGSEAWISINPAYHNQGYQLGTAFLREFREMGLTLRGIKTRRHSKGNDYYGIIRESVELGIPAIIVEHCHVDHKNDNIFCDSEEELKAFGKADARAVAKYFGLKSSKFGIDYSEEADLLPEVTPGTLVPRATQDTTQPELCQVTLNSASFEENKVNLTITAKDSESNLMYYAYSLDGGLTYSETFVWPEGDILTGEYAGSFTMDLDIPDGTTPLICFRAGNPYDLYCESNVLSFDQPFQRPVENDTLEPSFEDATNKITANSDETIEDTEISIYTIVQVFIAVLVVLFLLFIMFYFLYSRKLKSRSGRHKNTQT